MGATGKVKSARRAAAAVTNRTIASPSPTPRSLRSPWVVRIGALLFSAGVFTISWWYWWTFQYGTYDLAFYVQALWLALRGTWTVPMLDVPLMGNHAEPIVFLLLPLFAIWPHPMLFVAVQSLALGSMACTGFRIAVRLGFDAWPATWLALATLLLPATGSVAVYEFHPEALTAPLLLLLVEAKLAGRLGWFWLWFAAVLASKENMTLLLLAFCVVFGLIERRRGLAWQLRWNVLPGLVAATWLVLYGIVISPALNPGNVDYPQIYAHLGRSGGEIVKNFVVEPWRAGGAIWRALTQGDMVWSLLLPFLLLPLLRPRWLVIAAPILLQHLLSVRHVEWSLGSHHVAPLIPLFWIAAVEAARRLSRPRQLAIALAAACLLGHLRFGPAGQTIEEIPQIPPKIAERAWKAEMVAAIPPQASVTAGLTFLSHLTTRERLYSLHHVLKGMKTLSAKRNAPPPTDTVLIDYTDGNTFSTDAGYYHARSRFGGERGAVPSSDRLLHEFLAPHRWHVQARNSVALLTRGEPLPALAPGGPPLQFDGQTTLLGLHVPQQWPGAMLFRLTWQFGPDRQRFPWLMIVAADGRHLYPLVRGICAPEAGPGIYVEEWLLGFPSWLPAGRYQLFALFYDGNEAAWKHRLPPGDKQFVWKQLDLGQRDIRPGDFPLATTAGESMD